MPINNRVDEIIGEAEKGPVDFKVFLVSGYEFKREGPIPDFAKNLLLEFVKMAPDDQDRDESEGVPVAYLGLDDWSDGIGIMAWPSSDDGLSCITRTARRVFKAFGVKRYARIAAASVRMASEGPSINPSTRSSHREEDMLVLSFVDPPSKPQACFLPLERDWPELDHITTVEVQEDSRFVNFMEEDLIDGLISLNLTASTTIH